MLLPVVAWVWHKERSDLSRREVHGRLGVNKAEQLPQANRQPAQVSQACSYGCHHSQAVLSALPLVMQSMLPQAGAEVKKGL